MNDYSLFVIIHTSNKSYLTFTVLGEAGKSTSDGFLKTESGYPKCKSESATFTLFHQTVQEYDMCRTRILFFSFFEDSLVTQIPR